MSCKSYSRWNWSDLLGRCFKWENKPQNVGLFFWFATWIDRLLDQFLTQIYIIGTSFSHAWTVWPQDIKSKAWLKSKDVHLSPLMHIYIYIYICTSTIYVPLDEIHIIITCIYIYVYVYVYIYIHLSYIKVIQSMTLVLSNLKSLRHFGTTKQ